MSWKDFQIGTKVLLIGVMFVTLSIIMGVFWISDLKQSNIAVKTLFEDRVTPLVDLSTIAESVLKVRSMELRASSSFNEDIIIKTQNEATAMADSMWIIWTGYIERDLSVNERDLADRFVTAWESYLADAKKTYLFAVDGLEDDAVVNVKSKSAFPFNVALSLLDEIKVLQREKSQAIFADSQTSFQSSVKKTIAIVIIGIVITFAVLVALFRSVVTPIRKVIVVLKDIAEGEGDLTSRLNVPSKDEVGEMAYWFNQFVGKLHGIIKGVAASSEKMVREVEALKSVSGNMTKGVSAQAKSTESIAASIEEMSTSISQVAASSSDVSDLVNESVRVVSSGNKVVEDSLVGMEKIFRETQCSSEIVERLGQNSSSIDNIVLVIEDIADQTNLLALNAAIEAARAGEHGRGFAIVSDEVRKLAEKTIKATKEISLVISNIHSDTSEAVKSMDLGKREVSHGVELTNESGKALQAILKMVNSVQEQISQIATAMEQQSSTAENISKDIEGITTESRNVNSEVESVNLAIQNLANVSQDLKSAVGSFTI